MSAVNQEILHAVSELKKSLKSYKIEKIQFDLKEFNAHLNLIIEGLHSYDIETINSSRFGLEDVLKLDPVFFNSYLAIKLFEHADNVLDHTTELVDAIGNIGDPQRDYLEIFKIELEKLVVKKQNIGISLLDYDLLELEKYSDEERNGLLRLLIGNINQPDLTHVNGVEEVQLNIMQFVFVIKLLKIANKFQLLFYFAGQVADKINFHNDYQLGRDFAENFIHIAIKENQNIELANFVLGVTTIRQNNIFLSLIHMNAFFSGIKKYNEIDMHFFSRGLKECQKILRNMKLLDREELLFNKIVTSGFMTGWDFHEIHHIHFSGQLQTGNPDLPNQIYKFLIKNMEDIIQRGHHGSMGWYNTLVQLEDIYGYSELFEPYIKQFGMMISPDQKSKIDKMHSLDVQTLKKRIIEEVVKLSKTRSARDLKSDLYIASFLGHKAIIGGFKKNDPELFLYGITVVSDYSISQNEDEASEKSYQLDRNSDEVYYSDEEVVILYNQLITFSSNNSDSTLVSIGRNHSNLYSIEMSGSNFRIQKLNSSRSELSIFLESIREELYFQEHVKVGNINYPVEPWQNDEILATFLKKIPVMPFQLESSEYYIVTDNDLSSFPHNFLKLKNGSLLLDKSPVANILSLLLFIKRKWNQSSFFDLTMAEMWSPVEDGDPTLNKVLTDFYSILPMFKLDVSAIPRMPLTGDINVVIAHGAQDIHSSGFFYTGGGHAITNMDAIFGKGKIAILFVCHSGSERSSNFDQSVESVARKLISNGYEAVIAPFWSLHISIPPIWFKAFLDNLKAGKSSLEAFYEGVSVVRHSNSHPGAWLCLHYFGNPNLYMKREDD